MNLKEEKLNKEEWYDNKFATPICKIVSEMIETPIDGIFQTSKCYKALNDLITSELLLQKQQVREMIEGMYIDAEYTHAQDPSYAFDVGYNKALENLKTKLGDHATNK